MLRLLLLETEGAGAEPLAAALSGAADTVCRREPLEQWEWSAPPSRADCDVVVLDLGPARRDPDHVCRRVAARIPDRPLVAVTTTDDVDLAIRLVEAGADEVCLHGERGADQLLLRMRAATARHQTGTLWQEVAATAGHAAGHSPALQFTLQRDRTATDPELLTERGPAVRALSVDPTARTSPPRTWIRTAGFDLPLDVDCVPNMPEAIRALERAEFDVVVLRILEPCEAALVAVTVLRSCAPDAQLFVSGTELDHDFLVEAIHRGADDVLGELHDRSAALTRSIRTAFARKRRWREALEAVSDTTTA